MRKLICSAYAMMLTLIALFEICATENSDKINLDRNQSWNLEIPPFNPKNCTIANLTRRVDSLAVQLSDNSCYVRVNACWTLGAMGEAHYDLAPRIVSILTEKLCGKAKSDVRIGAAYALGVIGEAHYDLARDIVSTLTAKLNNTNPNVLYNIFDALDAIGSTHSDLAPEIVSALTTAQFSDDIVAKARDEAVDALKKSF